ncbi:MAG: PAS domain-containing sensor histidine kinase [Burkholderiaceae bacterium]|nr:PAS domain-containing sensor histidine kinase [Burkholderiaceae bacterium]
MAQDRPAACAASTSWCSRCGRTTGWLAGFVGSASEITELVAAEASLKAQLAFNELLMDHSPLPMSVVDGKRRYLRVNRAWEAYTGRTRQQVVGREVGGHLTAEDRAEHAVHDRRLHETGTPQRYESRVVHADGSVRDVLISKVLVPIDAGAAGVLSVLVDVTDLRRAERTTREARDAAEEASRAKSEFIANVSHELRTPLQAIIGFSELGVHRGRAHEKLAAMFGDIHAAGQRMLQLVNNLLDVARIESAVGSIHLERTDLRGLVHELLRELEPLLQARSQAVDLSLPAFPLVAKVDPLRLQQVMRNVLANAMKFSPAGTRIALLADYNDAGEPHLVVRDRGPGIPEAEVETIFEAFAQSSRTKDGSGGTGLGLAICRTIVAAHGGRIWAENLADGGAAFHILLPARGATETQPMDL